jgi:ATP-dependent Clp protease ATP-binding subunit ClpC
MSSPAIPQIETVVVVRELAGGECSVFPLADPSLVSFGEREACLEEQRLFLADHLAQARPEIIARFSHLPDVFLHEVPVVVARPDLPPRLRVRVGVPVVAAVIPRGRDRWVTLLPFAHTFYLGPREDLDESIRRETLRVCLARQLDGNEYRDLLLPSGTLRLERLTLGLESEDRAAAASGSVSVRRRLAESRQRKQALRILASVARPLHDRGRLERVPRLTGREREQAQLRSLLGGSERNAILLVGHDRVGKSALLHDWIRTEGREPHSRLVFATSAARLVAGMSGLGQWQERVRRVMAAAETLDAVLCFESLSELFGDRPQALVDIPGVLKPWLEERRVRVIGEITPEALAFAEARFAPFLGGFHRVALEPLGPAETTEALRLRAAQERDLTVTGDALSAILELGERYLPYESWPGKGVRLFDEVVAARRRESDAGIGHITVDAGAVYDAFSRQTGVPPFLLRHELPLRAGDVEAAIHRSIVGQSDAVRAVAETIAQVKAGLQPAGRPLASFLFIGPTGVGKTELARALAAYLFGSSDRLLRFDLSEYQDPLAAERLIRGTDRGEGVLTRLVRQLPLAVLLLDEIEKAHPAVHDILLQVLGEGRLTDAGGRTAFFRNAVIVMTSNVGASHGQTTIGMRTPPPRDDSFYERELGRVFRPEFLNRIGRIVPFRPLTVEEAEEVTKLSLQRLRQRRGLSEASVSLEVDEAAIALLASRGHSPVYGARALRRHLEDELVAPLARLLAGQGATLSGSVVTAFVDDGAIGFTVDEREPSRGGGSQLAGLSAMRREIDRWSTLAAVVAVKDRIDFLVVQLAMGRNRRPKRGEQLQTARLQEELHRLQEVWERLDRLRNEAHAIEEIGLAASLDGQDPGDLTAGMPAVRQACRRALLEVLMAPWKRRNQITLLLTEIDAGALLLWLEPLARERKRLGWTLSCHIDGGSRDSQDAWPERAGRRYGPPRDPDRVVAEIEAFGETPCAVVLSAIGPDAGTLLALEHGLHQYVGARDDRREKLHFHCQVLTWRGRLDDDDWKHPRLATALLKDARENLRAAPPVRRTTGDEKRPPDSGWWLPITFEQYWEQFEEIALEHLLAVALAADGSLDDAPAPPLVLDEAEEP